MKIKSIEVCVSELRMKPSGNKKMAITLCADLDDGDDFDQSFQALKTEAFKRVDAMFKSREIGSPGSKLPRHSRK